MSELVLVAMVIWMAMMFIAMWLNPSTLKGQRGPDFIARSRLAAIAFTGGAIAILLAVLFLIGRPWSAVISSTLLLATGTVAVYHAWKHRHSGSHGGSRQRKTS
jgi:hypothetical protein